MFLLVVARQLMLMMVRVGFGLVLVENKIHCLAVSKVTHNLLFVLIGIKPKPLPPGPAVVYLVRLNGSMLLVVVVKTGSIPGGMKGLLVLGLLWPMAWMLAVVVIVLGQFAANQMATQLTACAIWLAMFGSGFRIGITIVTMKPQLMVQLGNHLQALAGFFAAAPGATTPGTCGQRIAPTTRPAAASLTLAFALPSRCARSLAPWILGSLACAPVGQATAQRRRQWPTGAPGVARLQDGGV